MDILAVATQEVQEIFSDITLDVSTDTCVETLEETVKAACREVGRKVLEACLSAHAAEAIQKPQWRARGAVAEQPGVCVSERAILRRYVVLCGCLGGSIDVAAGQPSSLGSRKQVFKTVRIRPGLRRRCVG